MPLPPGAVMVSREEYERFGRGQATPSTRSRGLGDRPSLDSPSLSESYLGSMMERFIKGSQRMLGSQEQTVNPFTGEFVGGMTDVAKAGLQAAAPVALTAGAATAPLATAIGIPAGAASEYLSEALADYLPIPEGYKEALGFAGGLLGGVAGGKGAQALARKTARGRMAAGLRATSESRQYGRDVGTSALEETSGIRAENILNSAEERITELSNALDKIVSSGHEISLAKPRALVDDALTTAAKQNNPTLHSLLLKLKSRLYENSITGKKFSEKIDAKSALDLKRGINEEFANFQGENNTGLNNVAKALFRSLGDEIKAVDPQLPSIDERLSNLLQVKNLARKAMTEPNVDEASGFLDAARKMLPSVNRGLARVLYGSGGGAKTLPPSVPEFLKRLPSPEPQVAPRVVSDFASVGSEYSPEAKMAGRMLPAPNTGIGVSGVTMPGTTATDIQRTVNLAPRMIAAPEPGQPPINVQGGMGNVGFGSQTSHAKAAPFNVPPEGYNPPQATQPKFYELPTVNQKAQDKALTNVLRSYYQQTLVGKEKSISELLKELQRKGGGY